MVLTGTSSSWTVEEITIISWNVSVTCVFLFEFDICSFYSGGLDISILFIKKQDSGLRARIHVLEPKHSALCTLRKLKKNVKKSRNDPNFY
jgi:hypothetical protein